MPARVVRAQVALAEGAGNMQVAAHRRRSCTWTPAGGMFTYEDRNYQGRSGWKEIVGPGGKDRSAALDGVSTGPDAGAAAGTEDRIFVDRSRRAGSPAGGAVSRGTRCAGGCTAPSVGARPGDGERRRPVVKGDFLSKLLGNIADLCSLWMILTGPRAAFVLGAMHAFTPWKISARRW